MSDRKTIERLEAARDVWKYITWFFMAVAAFFYWKYHDTYKNAYSVCGEIRYLEEENAFQSTKINLYPLLSQSRANIQKSCDSYRY